MEIFAAAFLGVIQGLTEFLPISSSAHLILVPWLLGWNAEGLVFDVALHVGTSVAILAYFWKDWLTLAREWTVGVLKRDPLGNAHRRLAWFLIVGTLPAGAAGLALEKYIDEHLRSPVISVVTLIVFGGLLYYAERKSTLGRSLEEFNWSDSLWIGTSQALALIPGVSRSGVTISVAMLRDSSRSAAARFSFLLSTPVIVGAGVLKGWHFLKVSLHSSSSHLSANASNPVEVKWMVLLAGVASAAVTGFLCIRYFLRYIQTKSFTPFVIYRFVLAVVVLILYLRQ